MMPTLICALALAASPSLSQNQSVSQNQSQNQSQAAQREYGAAYQVYQAEYPNGVSRAELEAMLAAHTEPTKGRELGAISKAGHAAKHLALMAAADAAATLPAYSAPRAVNWLITLHLETQLKAQPLLRRSFDYMDTLTWQYVALGQLTRAKAIHSTIAANLPNPVRKALAEDRSCYDFLLASFTEPSPARLQSQYQQCKSTGKRAAFRRPAAAAWRFIEREKRRFASFDEYAKALSH